MHRSGNKYFILRNMILIQFLMTSRIQKREDWVPIPGTFTNDSILEYKKMGRWRAAGNQSLFSKALEQVSQGQPNVRLPNRVWRCSVGKARSCKCLLKATHLSVTEGYKLEISGSHTHQEGPSKGLAVPAAELVDELFARNPSILAGTVLNSLFNRGLGASETQIQSRLRYLRQRDPTQTRTKKHFDGTYSSLSSLIEASISSVAAHDNLDKPVVITMPGRSSPFRHDILLTTKRLISCILWTQVIYVDATHDVFEDKRIKVLTLSITDGACRYFTLAYLVSPSEDKEGYINLRCAISEYVFAEFGFRFEPKVIVADGLNYIQSVFPNSLRIFCVVHLLRRLEPAVSAGPRRRRFNKVFRILRACFSEPMFNVCLAAFCSEFQEIREIIQEYLSSETRAVELGIWTRAKFEDDGMLITCTNNPAESGHRALKSRISGKKRDFASMLEFLISELLLSESVRISPGQDRVCLFFNNFLHSKFNRSLYRRG
jgi:hypothetical protein